MSKSIITLVLGLLFSLLNFELNGQTLQANQGSSISGPEELCAEQSGTYFFDHPQNCQCDDISWTVTNGSFDPPGSGTSAPNNRVVKVIWDKGVSNGKLIVRFRKCYKDFDQDGNPKYSADYQNDDEYQVHIIDAEMTSIRINSERTISCNTTEVTVKIESFNNYLSAYNLQNIIWTIPAGWQIQNNSQINGENYGARFPNVKISTNAPLYGNYTISLSYTSPSFCPSKTYSRSVQLNIGDCLNEISYETPPNYFQSHSKSVTNFDFNQAQVLSSGSNYQFPSGGVVNIYDNFDIRADKSTSFNAFIAECGCGSPWQDPNLRGESGVVYTGNFRKFEGTAGLKEGTISEYPSSYFYSEEGFQVYPNPSDGIIYIQANRTSKERLKIQIMDLNGRIVQEALWMQNPKSQSFGLKLNNELNGLYLIQITISDGALQFRQKILVQ